jgi:precorrin-4/cobalt-precorrin-4 C11-methyltransferase
LAGPVYTDHPNRFPAAVENHTTRLTSGVFAMPSLDNLHPVLFVGAGPGDPELITVKGRNALAEADLVVYAGSLVPKALLQWCRPNCTAVDSAGIALEQIVAQMERAHRDGRRVVRLHTGDPSLYGAMAEQIAALEERGVPCRVIPGVTAAFAAAAAMCIEYTLPEACQTLILTRAAGRTPVPEKESLASLACHRAAMAIYLSVHLVDQVVEALRPSYGAEAPCAVVYRVSQPGERILRTHIGKLAETVRREGIRRQALIIVGEALAGTDAGGRRQSRLYNKHFSHGFRRS